MENYVLERLKDLETQYPDEARAGRQQIHIEHGSEADAKRAAHYAYGGFAREEKTDAFWAGYALEGLDGQED